VLEAQRDERRVRLQAERDGRERLRAEGVVVEVDAPQALVDADQRANLDADVVAEAAADEVEALQRRVARRDGGLEEGAHADGPLAHGHVRRRRVRAQLLDEEAQLRARRDGLLLLALLLLEEALHAQRLLLGAALLERFAPLLDQRLLLRLELGVQVLLQRLDVVLREARGLEAPRHELLGQLLGRELRRLRRLHVAAVVLVEAAIVVRHGGPATGVGPG